MLKRKSGSGHHAARLLRNRMAGEGDADFWIATLASSAVKEGCRELIMRLDPTVILFKYRKSRACETKRRTWLPEKFR